MEAGHGHIVTAEAIAECLENKYGDRIEVVRDYVFRDSDDKQMQKFEKFTTNEVRKSNTNKFYLNFQMFCMKLLGEDFTLNFTYSTVFRAVRNKLIAHMAEQNADMYVSTHFMTLHSGIVGKRAKKFSGEVIAYNPDHNTHGWWDRHADLFITNNNVAAKQAIEERKMNPEIVKTVHFMSRKVIQDTNESKEFYREKHNIPKDKFTIVLADGAYAVAKLEAYTKALLESDKELTIIPICGKNKKLYKKFSELAGKTKPNITLIPKPFIEYIPEIYKAADLFITKAGPNAITDCVFMGTPILINYCSGVIERTTAKLFTKDYGCGVYEPNVKKAIKKVESWVEDRTELNQMAKNTAVLDKRINGAEEIADMLAKRLLG